MKAEHLIRPCVACGAFDVELYDEVKSLGPFCVDRAACTARFEIRLRNEEAAESSSQAEKGKP